jgi:hypothetical protein
MHIVTHFQDVAGNGANVDTKNTVRVERSRIRIPPRARDFSETSTRILKPTQRPLWCIPQLFPGREVNHSPSPSLEGKEKVDRYIYSPIRLHGVNRDNFIFSWDPSVNCSSRRLVLMQCGSYPGKGKRFFFFIFPFCLSALCPWSIF